MVQICAVIGVPGLSLCVCVCVRMFGKVYHLYANITTQNTSQSVILNIL